MAASGQALRRRHPLHGGRPEDLVQRQGGLHAGRLEEHGGSDRHRLHGQVPYGAPPPAAPPCSQHPPSLAVRRAAQPPVRRRDRRWRHCSRTWTFVACSGWSSRRGQPVERAVHSVRRRHPIVPAWRVLGIRPLLRTPERSLGKFLACGRLRSSPQAAPKLRILHFSTSTRRRSRRSRCSMWWWASTTTSSPRSTSSAPRPRAPPTASRP